MSRLKELNSTIISIPFVNIILRRIILGLSYILRRTVPKKKNLVIFGAMNGLWYGDNSRHLFEWMLKHSPSVECLWLTHSTHLYRKLVSNHLPAALTTSHSGLLALYQAKAAVYTNSLYDIGIVPWIVPDDLPLLALRHGRSVKRVRFAAKQNLSPIEFEERRSEAHRIKFAISTSPFISRIQETCLQIGSHKHVVTGYPRNDVLFDTPYETKSNWSKFLGRKTYHTTILYAPTWRHGREPTHFFPFEDMNIYKLTQALEDHNILLLLRPHVNDLLKYPKVKEFIDILCNASERIRLATHREFADINHILPFINVLISDYSAVYHDFLLLNRPIIFIPYDIQDFEEKNGFLYDYHSMLPGPSVTTLSEFIEALSMICSGKDTYRTKREHLRHIIHTYFDAGSSERVSGLIMQMLYENSQRQ